MKGINSDKLAFAFFVQFSEVGAILYVYSSDLLRLSTKIKLFYTLNYLSKDYCLPIMAERGGEIT